MDIEAMKLAVTALKEMFNLENINRIIKLEDGKEYEIIFKRSSIQLLEGVTKKTRIEVFQGLYSQLLMGQVSVTDSTQLIWAGMKNKSPRVTIDWLLDNIPIDPKKEKELVKQVLEVYLYDTRLIETMEKSLETLGENTEKGQEKDLGLD
jgi:hypothetical protein